MRLLIMGPQGSGKGVQGELIEKRLKIKHIVMGDLLREEAQKDSDTGRELSRIMNEGKLVPNHITNEIIARAIDKNKDRSFLLDGYPRDEEQAEFLSTITKIDKVIYLKVKDEICIKRISSRRICPNGHVFNIITMPPKKKGICDYDGLKLFQREDDKEEVVKRRLKIFHEQTAALLEMYKDKLLIIDGSKSLEEVYSDIVEVLNI